MIAPMARAGIAAALLATNSVAFVASAPPRATGRTPSNIEALGGGFTDKLICVGCVTAGILIVGSGAGAWGVLVANPGLTAAAAGECIYACSAAY